jgi:hypothetical protein
MAAATGAVFDRIFAVAFGAFTPSVTAVTTFVFGLWWARLLRRPATFPNIKIRRGWVASIPLAMMNSAMACGILFGLEHFDFDAFVRGALLGATFGVICWGPGLVATLAFIGLPIAWSQHLAKKGLAGEERGELVVGAVSLAIGAQALALFLSRSPDDGAPSAARLGFVLVAAFGVVAVVAGGLATALARKRQLARRAFVEQVEAGSVAGYRIDKTEAGKVLVRISSMGEGYRVANFEEPVYGLDEAGEARRALGVAAE